jgi:uncharacterized protein YlxW (UPF0749 family)
VDGKHSRGWIFKITAMSMILGMLIAACLTTQGDIRRNYGVAGMRFDELAGLYQSKSRENDRLRAEIKDLKEKNTELLNTIAAGSSDATALNEELLNSKVLAGLTEVEGPGVVVTLRDSQKKVEEPGLVDMSSLYVIHDTDIRNVTNELQAAGAEAVSVSGQRLIATSAIRCAGPVILVNDVDTAAPYVIKAIGDPKTLESALRMREGIVDQMPDPKMIDISQGKNVKVEPFSGSTKFRYVRPTPDGG